MSVTNRPITLYADSQALTYFVGFRSNSSEHNLEFSNEWNVIEDENIRNEIITPIVSEHSSVLNGIVSSVNDAQLYIAGSSVMNSLESIEAEHLDIHDIDIFVKRMSDTEIERLRENLQQSVPSAVINIRPSRGDPENRRVIEISLNGFKYQITEYEGDFLPYSQELINGQIVVEYNLENPRVLTGYSDIEKILNSGFNLPLHENNFRNIEWIYSSLRYLCEVSMHGGIYPDRIVLEKIRNAFNSFDITELSDEEISVIENAFVHKLKESFERIQSSKEKDSRLFVALLGYSHALRKLLPATWTISHFSNEGVYSKLSEKTFSFEQFEQALCTGNINLISNEVLELAGIDREMLKDNGWRFSPALNRRILKGAKQLFENAIENAPKIYEGVHEKYNIKITNEKLKKNLHDASEEFLRWRGVYVWTVRPDVNLAFPDHDKFLDSFCEQIELKELLSGEASHIAHIGYFVLDVLSEILSNGVPKGLKKNIIRRNIVFRYLDTLGFIDSSLLLDLKNINFRPEYVDELLAYLYRTKFYGYGIHTFKMLDEKLLIRLYQELKEELPLMIMLERD